MKVKRKYTALSSLGPHAIIGRVRDTVQSLQEVYNKTTLNTIILCL